MKERRLVELISLPQPKAGRFELRSDGGTTLILINSKKVLPTFGPTGRRKGAQDLFRLD